jgi:hypothetical protein
MIICQIMAESTLAVQSTRTLIKAVLDLSDFTQPNTAFFVRAPETKVFWAAGGNLFDSQCPVVREQPASLFDHGAGLSGARDPEPDVVVPVVGIVPVAVRATKVLLIIVVPGAAAKHAHLRFHPLIRAALTPQGFAAQTFFDCFIHPPSIFPISTSSRAPYS